MQQPSSTSPQHTKTHTKDFDYDPELSYRPVPAHSGAIVTDQRSKPQYQGGVERRLLQLEQLLDWLFRAMMLFVGLALAGLMFGQIIMRYLLESPFTGIEEAAVLLGVWIYFLGMGYATREREHIHGGIVSLLVSDPFKVGLIRFSGSMISMIAAVVFGYFACKYAFFVIEKGRMSINLQWPRGLWSGSMIVGFGMMVGYFMLEAIKEYRDLQRIRYTGSPGSNRS